MRLKNKVIIITGSCTGIGKAIAIRCVEEGAKVIITGLEKDLGEEVMEIVGSSNAVLHIEDITNEGSTQRLVQVAIKKFNRLDAVVNNAAWVTSSNIHTTEPEYFRKVLEINTIAPFNLIRAALPELKKTKGSVLNIGSVNAYCGESNLQRCKTGWAHHRRSPSGNEGSRDDHVGLCRALVNQLFFFLDVFLGKLARVSSRVLCLVVTDAELDECRAETLNLLFYDRARVECFDDCADSARGGNCL